MHNGTQKEKETCDRKRQKETVPTIDVIVWIIRLA